MPESGSSGDEAQVTGVLRQLQDDLIVLTKARLSFLVVMTACFGYFVAR